MARPGAWVTGTMSHGGAFQLRVLSVEEGRDRPSFDQVLDRAVRERSAIDCHGPGARGPERVRWRATLEMDRRCRRCVAAGRVLRIGSGLPALSADGNLHRGRHLRVIVLGGCGRRVSSGRDVPADLCLLHRHRMHLRPGLGLPALSSVSVGGNGSRDAAPGALGPCHPRHCAAHVVWLTRPERQRREPAAPPGSRLKFSRRRHRCCAAARKRSCAGQSCLEHLPGGVRDFSRAQLRKTLRSRAANASASFSRARYSRSRTQVKPRCVSVRTPDRARPSSDNLR